MSSPNDTSSGRTLDNNEGADVKPAWRQVFDQVTNNPLQQIRDAGEKWANLLATLIGVSTLLGLFQVRDNFIKLRPETQLLLLGVSLLFFATFAGAIYLATTVSATGKSILADEQSFIAWYRDTVSKASKRLGLSRVLGLAAIFLLIVAFIITLIGTQQPGTSILAVQKSGLVVCGTLATDKAGNLLLTRVGLPLIILKDVVSFNVVSSCP